MNDIFENTIFCKECNSEMEETKIVKNGFLLRTIICKDCKEKIIHRLDEHNYNKFINLNNKKYSEKLRLIRNSYAISIPKEIVSFMNSQRTMMDDMVRLCFEEMGKLSLSFNEIEKIRKNN